jgi:hypothetical protein
MRRLAVVLLIGCSAPAAPRDVPANRQPPPPPATCAPIDADDALALAGKPDDVHAIDLDGDPATIERMVEHQCSGLRCTYAIYAQRAECWVSLGSTGDLMSEPGCERGSAKGAYCTLSGMRLMIHGDAQEYLFPFDGRYGEELAGTRYVPPMDKYP